MSAAWFHDTSGIMDLHVSQLMSARSFTFKESKKLDPKRESFPSIQAVQVCTIDEFIARYGAPCPNYIRSTCRASHRTSLPAQRKRSQIRRLDRFRLRRESTKVAGALPSSWPPLGFKLMRPGTRCDGKLQSHLVLVRDILGTNDVAAPAPSASNQVGFRRGAAEPSR